MAHLREDTPANTRIPSLVTEVYLGDDHPKFFAATTLGWLGRTVQMQVYYRTIFADVPGKDYAATVMADPFPSENNTLPEAVVGAPLRARSGSHFVHG